MWIARFKLYHKDCPAVNTCVKHETDVTSYPLGFYVEGQYKYVTTLCRMMGSQDKKKEYVEDFRKDENITNIDVNDDFFAYEYRLDLEEGEHVQLYTNHKMFFTKPTFNSHDKHEYWELASWDKSVLTRFSDEVSSHMDSSEMLGISRKSNYDVFVQNATPKLSKNQKEALRLAYTHNYYSYPRRIDLSVLAKKAGISISTYQEHLRRAENKLMPLLANRLLNLDEAN
jgi:predicted DNA binding protein